jgi:hypothetical protein
MEGRMPGLVPGSIVAIALFAAGCASQHAAEASLAAAGCKIDAAQACASVRGQEINMEGMSADQRMVEQNSSATAPIHITVHFPSGDPDLQVRCDLNSRTQAVVYAEVLPGPALSDKDIDYLRGSGFCSP